MRLLVEIITLHHFCIGIFWIDQLSTLLFDVAEKVVKDMSKSFVEGAKATDGESKLTLDQNGTWGDDF